MKKQRGVRGKEPAEERQRDSTRHVLSELLKLPTDVVCGDTVICILGKSRVKVENYRNIVIYSETMIKLQTKNERIEIIGKKLRIRYYDKDEMEITGRIEGVRFG